MQMVQVGMKALSAPIVTPRYTIPSRCFLSPINTGYAENGNPNNRLMSFHSARSGKGIGISFVGTTAISRDTAPNRNTLILDSQSDLNAFARLSDCIRRNGSIPGIQLGCRLTKIDPQRVWRVTSSRKLIQSISRELLSYSHSNLVDVCETYYEAISLAVRTGYEAIQLHGAHGYFVSLLLCPVLNLRRDEFGFPECRLPFEIIERTRRSFPNVILSVRINCIYGLTDDKEELELTSQLAHRLFRSGVDLIDLSAGMYDINKHLIYPSVRDGHTCYLNHALKVRRQVANDVGVISFAGNVWDLAKVSERLEGEMAVSIGRSLIADPQFVTKSLSGHADDIVQCMRKRTCPCHYFSNNRNSIECSENENLGHET